MNKIDTHKSSNPVTTVICSSDSPFVSSLRGELRGIGHEFDLWSDDIEQKAHILVLDVDSSDEFEAIIRQARARNPRVLIVAVGGSPSNDQLIRLIRAGAYDFVDKPAGAAALATKLRSLGQQALISHYSAEISSRLKGTGSLLDRDQSELHREIVRSNEELVAVNRKLQRVVAQLKTLYHMGHDLAENENWSDALDRFLMAFVSFMDANGTALLLFSEAGTVLSSRSNFGVDQGVISSACATLRTSWRSHPRAGEIHCIESYEDRSGEACLDRKRPWDITVIPLRHRNRPLGFLLLDKGYGQGYEFKWDYDFLNTLQTIFVEEIANASYISELRRLDRFNNKVLDNIGSGVITTDLAGTIRYHNISASEMCPRLRGNGGGGSRAVHFNDLFCSRQYGEAFFERVRDSAKDGPILEVECNAAIDKIFPAKLRVAKMYDDILGGEVIVAIFEDLTEQKHMEAEIRRNDRLRVLGQLSAGVAHEIRNPLTGIATSAEVLSSKLDDDDDKKRFLTAMLEEINRLDGIIRNLLNFAKPPRLRMAQCPLGPVVEKVGVLLSDQAATEGVAVKLAVPDGEIMSFADSGQITQVLLNVVLNAIQACHEGNTVKVALKGGGGPGAARARIEVEDDGPGVPAEVRSSLFDPFVTSKTMGSGLGLAISRQIMEDHQGQIGCEFLERGTRFIIELPQLAPVAKTQHVQGS